MITYSRYGRLRHSAPMCISTINNYGMGTLHTRFVDQNITNPRGDSRNFIGLYSSNLPAWYPSGMNTFNWYDIKMRVVFNELGDGVNDFMLRKAHVEVVPDDRYLVYVYSGSTLYNAPIDGTGTPTGADPILQMELRANAWLDSTVTTTAGLPRTGGTKFDLVKLNMNVVGGANPFLATLEAPSGTTHTQQYTPGTNANPKESLTLIAPDNATFRRAKITYLSTITAVLRGFTVQLSRYERKNWG